MLANSLACPGAAAAARGAARHGAAARLFQSEVRAGMQPPAAISSLRRSRSQGLCTAALAVAVQRGEAAEDAPRDPAAAAAYRKLLAEEEEAGLYEEPVEEERVEVDASAVPDDSLALVNFNLTKETHAALSKRGIEKLFPIQGATFKPLSEGRDLIGRARTGTGKTLAFSLPLIEKLIREDHASGKGGLRARAPRMLVMAPTRELAMQVEREITASAPTLSVACIYGGASVSVQEGLLRRGVDVVVGTPGRLIDLVQRRALSFASLKHVVLDEADQMLAVGFEEDVEQLMEAMPAGEQRQILLFSATMPHWVKKLSRRYMREPVTVDLVGESSQKIAPTVRMLSLQCDPRAKQALLADLVSVHAAGSKAICFTSTKRECDEVALALGRRCLSEALHGDIAQGQREKTLRRFREGRITVLVATDVAARGLDIDNVDLVVHYNFPNDTESFVHRSGRTGRAGRSGTAIALHTEREEWMLKRLSKETGAAFERISPPSAANVMDAAAKMAVKALSAVDPLLLPFFEAQAQELISTRGGAQALAAALALVSGHTEPPAARSLLTGEEGVLTLRMERTGPSGPAIASARDVLRILQRVPAAAGSRGATPADSVGKIRMLAGGAEAAVLDMPRAQAAQLLALGDLHGLAFTEPAALPPLAQEEAPARAPFSPGRFSGGYAGRGGGFSRDGGRGGGYADRAPRSGYGREGGDRFSRGGSDRGGGYGGDRGGGGGYGGGSGGYGGDRDRGGRSGFSRSGGGSSGRSYSTMPSSY